MMITKAIFKDFPRGAVSRRLLVGVVVCVLWLGMMTWLWRREGGGGGGLTEMGVEPEVLLVNWVDYDQWMWVEQNGTRLGATRTSIRVDSTTESALRSTLPDYLMDNRWRLRFRMMGMPIPIDAALHVRMNGSFEMQTMQCRARLAGRLFSLDGFVEDRSLFYEARLGADAGGTSGSMVLTPGMAGDAAALFQDREIRGRAPLKGPMLLGDVLAPVLMRRENLAEGQSWQTRVSDPIGGLIDQTVHVRVEELETLTIEGREVEAWRLSENTDSLQSTVWYDTTGNLLRREAYGGLVMTRTEPAAVMREDIQFRHDPEFLEIDRERIKQTLDPELDGKPIEALLPALPKL